MTDALVLLILIAGCCLALWLHDRLAMRRIEHRTELARRANAEQLTLAADIAEAQHARQMEAIAAQRRLNREWLDGQMKIEHPWRVE